MTSGCHQTPENGSHGCDKDGIKTQRLQRSKSMVAPKRVCHNGIALQMSGIWVRQSGALKTRTTHALRVEIEGGGGRGGGGRGVARRPIGEAGGEEVEFLRKMTEKRMKTRNEDGRETG